MTTETKLDLTAIRADFPILNQKIHDKPLVYLDNGASSQKPQCVIDRLRNFYEVEYANIHRAVHELSQVATENYEAARRICQRFLNAASDQECIFVRGTTEAINLVANTWGRANISQGDEIVITAMEHHSNIVPWQMLCEHTGAKLHVAPMDETGTLILDQFKSLLNEHTKLVGMVHVSNALGTINPVKKMIAAAHAVGAVCVVDGAQAAPHLKIDVQDIDADFYAISGHKVFAPTGVGILYGKKSILDEMPPWHGGGDMIKSVSFDKTEYNDVPHKFEAGTPNIAGGIALGTALEYVQHLGLEAIAAHEHTLTQYAQQELSKIDGLRLIGTSENKAGVVSFIIDGAHSTDVGMILDQQGIAIRSGHHCAEPVMHFFKVPGTIRASFAFYNTTEEVDALVAGVQKAVKLLRD
ncbi:MAG: SufS family cysteine desulfurase [Planctomycetota bacterium]|jgi:cysteine desulfurase/selenocysteine lyase